MISDLYQTMSHAHNPYGDGKACNRIVKYIKEDLNVHKKIKVFRNWAWVYRTCPRQHFLHQRASGKGYG